MSRLPVMALVGLLLLLQGLALVRAPDAWYPAAIAISLAPNETLALGRAELAASGAQPEHVQLRRDAAGSWFVRMLPGARPPVVGDTRMGAVAVPGMLSFQVGAAVFRVRQADAHSIVFTDGARDWRYDGATLYRDGAALAPCPDAPLSRKLVALWNRMVPRALTAARPLLVGGNLYCGNRLGLADIAAGAAVIARVDGALRLTAAPDGITPVLAGASDLRAQELRLGDARTLTVGATRYRLDLANDTLTLAPQRRVALFAVADVRLPRQVAWHWRPHNLWRGDPVAWTAALLAAAALFAPWLTAIATARPLPARGNILRPIRLARPPAPAAYWLAGAAVLAAGVVSLILQRAGTSPSAACSLLLAGCALTAWLVCPGRLGLAGNAALLLFGAGLLAQLDLGLGAPDTGWLRYYHKTAALLAAGFGAAMLWRLWAAARRPLRQAHVEWLLAALAAVALALLAAQVLWGDETGVFDLQPVELAKLVLAGLTAHCLALRMGWSADHAARPGLRVRWLHLLGPALLFLALLGFALVQVDDYSPLILLLLWAGALALAYALAAGRRWSAALLSGVALAGAVAVPALHAAGSERLPASFYGDRFQVWLAPDLHPHTGQQLLQGGAAIAQGGWLGADGMLGLTSLGRGAGGALAIPAVQDDFAPAFFLHRHGLLGGLLLWCLQAAVLAGLCHAAIRSARAAAAARGFRAAWRARLHAFALCGGAAFLAGHLLLSWGTNLAIVPVMGQPMSFLSAGGSHLLFFLLPLLGLHAASPSTRTQE
jgi:cell division protein FtsW